MRVEHPRTHGEKLFALRANSGLPDADRERVDKTIEIYEDWIRSLRAIEAEGDALLSGLVSALNNYKYHVEVDLIFDAEDSFLYRQNGQLKLANSVLEEFLPYLFDERLVPGFGRLKNVVCGPQSSFSGLSFGSPFLALNAGGVFIKEKDQDFVIAKTHQITISDEKAVESAFSRQVCVSHFATEIKTNLDKTMFQEAAQSANELKRAVPGARCILLCEYLDMVPITTKLTSIDEVIVLRKARRLSANIRESFRTSGGRRSYRDKYIEFLKSNPLHISSFERFVFHLNECFPAEQDDEIDLVLGRGYF